MEYQMTYEQYRSEQRRLRAQIADLEKRSSALKNEYFQRHLPFKIGDRANIRGERGRVVKNVHIVKIEPFKFNDHAYITFALSKKDGSASKRTDIICAEVPNVEVLSAPQ